MRRIMLLVIPCVVMATISWADPIEYDGVSLYVDSAPNAYGSPLWDPWWAAARAAAVDGTFQNQAGSHTGSGAVHPDGSLWMSAYDEIVYSVGDLGTRLHWIYWIPDATTMELASQDHQFQVRQILEWGGAEWTLDSANNWIEATPEAGWYTPTSWSAYEGGVIGTFGLAFWATGSDPGNPYGSVTQADINALAADITSAQDFARGEVRWHNSPAWMTVTRQVNMIPVPEPTTVVLLGLGLVGLAARGMKSVKR